MTEPHMNPAVILGEIIDTMRHDHATSQTGEIMIKHWERLLAVHLPIAQGYSVFGKGLHSKPKMS